MTKIKKNKQQERKLINDKRRETKSINGKKMTKAQKQPTNADMYIGKEAVVTEDINNLDAKGLVKVGGSIWSARTEVDNYTIPAGAHVTVIKIEGVKLIVRPIL